MSGPQRTNHRAFNELTMLLACHLVAAAISFGPMFVQTKIRSTENTERDLDEAMAELPNGLRILHERR